VKHDSNVALIGRRQMPIGQLASFKQFTMDARRGPERILAAHFAVQFSPAFRNRWSAKLAVTDSPSPEQPATLAVPVNDGIRLNDDQGRSPIVPNVAQPRSTGVARLTSFSALHRTTEDAESVPQHQVLQLKRGSRFEGRRHSGGQQGKCAERRMDVLTEDRQTPCSHSVPYLR